MLKKKLYVELKTKYPDRLVLIRDTDNLYKAINNDARVIYSVLMQKPIERLSNIAEVCIIPTLVQDAAQKLSKAGYRVLACDVLN